MSQFSDSIATIEATREIAYCRAGSPSVEVIRMTLNDGMRFSLSRLENETHFVVDSRYARNGMPITVTNPGDRFSMKYEMRDEDTHAAFLDARCVRQGWQTDTLRDTPITR